MRNIYHNIKRLMIKGSSFLSNINQSQDNIFNNKLDKTDSILTTSTNSSGLILDIDPNAAIAYSLNRQLRNAYSGPLFRIRRNTDDVEIDLHFNSTSRQVVVSQLKDFAGDNSLFVTKIYDQSGNGNDLTNSLKSSQPILADNGTILYDNGKLGMRHVLGTTVMLLTSTVNASSTFSSFTVSSRAGVSTKGMTFSSLGGNTFTVWHYSDDNIYTRGDLSYIVSSSTDTSYNQEVLTGIYSVAHKTQYRDSISITSTNNVTSSAQQFEHLTSDIGAYFSEAILYASDKTASRARIENNLITYYNPTISETGQLLDEDGTNILAEDGVAIDQG